MNRGDMRTQVRDIIGEDSEDFWKNAELNRYLQEALYAFAREARWPFYITEFTGMLSAGDPDLELTAGVAASRHLNITLQKSGQTRTYQPVRVSGNEGFQIRSQYSTQASYSYPGWFYVTTVMDDDGVPTYVARFVPTPISDMDVEGQYYRSPAIMDADTDIPDLPVEYHKALVHHAGMTAWLKELNGGGKANEQSQLYTAVVDKALREWQTEPDDAPLIMGGEEPQNPMHAPEVDPWLWRIPETLGP